MRRRLWEVTGGLPQGAASFWQDARKGVRWGGFGVPREADTEVSEKERNVLETPKLIVSLLRASTPSEVTGPHRYFCFPLVSSPPPLSFEELENLGKPISFLWQLRLFLINPVHAIVTVTETKWQSFSRTLSLGINTLPVVAGWGGAHHTKKCEGCGRTFLVPSLASVQGCTKCLDRVLRVIFLHGRNSNLLQITTA